MVGESDRVPHNAVANAYYFGMDRALAWLLAGLCFLIYLRTLAPGLLEGDGAELQMAAWRLGLAHPTGYPLYLIVGGAWQRLASLVQISPATALNAFSALCSGGTVAVLYLLMVTVLATGGRPSSIQRFCAGFSALLFGLNRTVWSQAVIAEVYGMHSLLTVTILALALPMQPRRAAGVDRARATWLLLFLGLGLAHHRTTLFLLPGIFLSLWYQDRQIWRRRWVWSRGVVALLLPQLLYLYVPLRSGANVSPWLYPKLDGETLALYGGSLSALVDFVTGRVFAVSFGDPGQALGRIPYAAALWQQELTWLGIVLALLGLWGLIRKRNVPLLLVTVPFVLILQIFNLFYAIGDIFVFYIPLYLVTAAWAGLGAHNLLEMWPQGRWVRPLPQVAPLLIGFLVVAWPLWLLQTNYRQVDQSANRQAQTQWQTILAAQPSANSILVSNDRNEIVPLYYLQAVVELRPDLTGLFPLLNQEARFADIVATTSTALQAGGGRPVYLIKAMPGLEIKFVLEPTSGPLVAVAGLTSQRPPVVPVRQTLGSLILLGYDWRPNPGSVTVTLHWQVAAPLDADYTATIQIYDAQGQKIGQDDHPPGGVYYPTSAWQTNDILVDTHLVQLPADGEPALLWIGMYSPPSFHQLDRPLKLPIPPPLVK